MFEIFRDIDVMGGACGGCPCSCSCGCGCGTCFGDPIASATNHANVYDSDHEKFDYDAFFKLGQLEIT